jgi:hypothetical protein
VENDSRQADLRKFNLLRELIRTEVSLALAEYVSQFTRESSCKGWEKILEDRIEALKKTGDEVAEQLVKEIS